MIDLDQFDNNVKDLILLIIKNQNNERVIRKTKKYLQIELDEIKVTNKRSVSRTSLLNSSPKDSMIIMKKIHKKSVNFLNNFDFSDQKEDEKFKKEIIRDSIEVRKNFVDNTFVSEKIILGDFDKNKKNSVQTKLNKQADNLRFSINNPNRNRKFTFEKLENKNSMKKKEKKNFKEIRRMKTQDNRNNKLDISPKSIGSEINLSDTNKKFGNSGKLSFNSFKEKNIEIKNSNLKFNLLDTFNPDFFQNENIISILILSNWGYINKIGISEIKLFDKNLQEVEQKYFDIKFYKNNKLVDKKKDLKNIVNKKIKSVKRNDNFVTDFDSEKNYKIVMAVQDNVKLSSICFWNYCINESMGIKHCKIFYNDNLVFDKDIQKSSNNGFSSNHTLINFFKDINIKKLNFIVEKICKISFKKDIPLFKNNQLPTFENPKKRKKNNYYPKSSDLKLKKKSISEFLNFDLINDNSFDKKKSPKFNKDKFIKKYNTKKDKNNITQNILKNLSKKKWSKSNLDDSSLKEKKTITTLSKKSHQKTDFSLDVFISGYSNQKIPILPELKGLEIRLLNSWGDKFFIGLNGIEIFDDNGKKIDLINKNLKIFSNSKKGFLPINNNNERIVNNNMNTSDQNRNWAYKIGLNLPIHINIDFNKKIKISMIRIWNYNRSRIHSIRGIKKIVITDIEHEILLFCGDIKKASGNTRNPFKNFESIFFTENKNIISQIAKNDWFFNKTKKKKENTLLMNTLYEELKILRPLTSDLNKEKMNINKNIRDSSNFIKDFSELNKSTKSYVSIQNDFNSDVKMNLLCNSLKIEFKETWGNLNKFGFMFLELFNENKIKIKNSNFEIKTNLKYINKKKLLKKQLCLNDNKIFRFNQNENYILFLFEKPTKISYLFFSNLTEEKIQMNISIKKIDIFMNDNLITPNSLYLKKNVGFLKNLESEKITFPIDQRLSFIRNPKLLGFVLEIRIKSSYGDCFYVGLNGIEIFNSLGEKILIGSKKVKFKMKAVPKGVTIFPEMRKDKRKVSNLVNGKNTSNLYEDIFLFPFQKFGKKVQMRQNIIYIYFKNPQDLGMINFWNYTKTEKRATKNLEIFLDGFLIYNGILNDPINNNKTSIIFNNKLKKMKIFDKSHLYKNIEEEKIELNNEGVIYNKRDTDLYLNIERPQTGLLTTSGFNQF